MTGPSAPKVMAACRRRVVFASLRGRRPFGLRVVAGALCGHAFGVRVQKVQRVLRVQRVVVSPKAMSMYAVEVLHRTSKSAKVGP